jgi:hypothetical protein
MLRKKTMTDIENYPLANTTNLFQVRTTNGCRKPEKQVTSTMASH